jgi:hypothetical protein
MTCANTKKHGNIDNKSKSTKQLRWHVPKQKTTGSMAREKKHATPHTKGKQQDLAQAQ